MAFDLVRTSVPTRDPAHSAPTPRASSGSGSERGHGTPLARAPAQREGVVSDAKAVVGPQKADETIVDAKELEKAVEELNRTLETLSVGTRFQVSREQNELQVIVENRSTGEVIRKIPPDEVLRRRENLERLAGLLFDTNA